MDPAGGLRTKRGILLAAGVSALLLGSARLVVDEVQLAGHAARARGLEQRAEGAARDRERLVRLEKDLQLDQERMAVLTGELEGRGRALDVLTEDLREARSEQLALEQRAAQAQRDLEGKLGESERVSAQRAADTQRLKVHAEQQAQKLEVATRRLEQSAERLALAVRDAESLQEDLAEQARAIAKLNADVRMGTDRASLAEEQLSQLEAAGVNVARLTGRRPMPRILAIVVRVDFDAVPPVILVDAGRDRGLERGDNLYVVRDGREVAQLEVEEVSSQASSTRVVRGQRGLRIRPGEDVTSVAPARPRD